MAASDERPGPVGAMPAAAPTETPVSLPVADAPKGPEAELEAALREVDPSLAAALETAPASRRASRVGRTRGRAGKGGELQPEVVKEEEAEEEEEEEAEEEDEEEGGDENPLLLNGAICLGKGVGAAVSGGAVGGLWGFGSGLWKKEGFKGALGEAGKNAKTFALLGGVHSTVTCSLESLRGAREAWHAGIAGCSTGLVLGYENGPQAALQSCAGFGAFSYILEYLQPSATAAPRHGPSRAWQARSTRQVDRLAHVDFPQTPACLEPVVRPIRNFHNRLKKAESRRVKKAIARELRK